LARFLIPVTDDCRGTVEFCDLSLPLEDDAEWSPWWARTRVRYQDHVAGRRVVRLLFGLSRRYLLTGLGWANETLSLSSHGTTHVDAPWHYGPHCGGRRARSIDELPLDWFYGPAVVLDVSSLAPTAAAGIDDLQAALAAANIQLTGSEIVLIRTGNDRLWGTREYYHRGPGISADATRWLVNQGIRVAGIDAWGWDAPLLHQAREAKRTGQTGVFWAAHYAGTEREFCHMERLANLDKLPPSGFTVCAFPLKVRRGSAGPARVVAMLQPVTHAKER
jgi:kynurenine formamidase